jgi:4-amino-4-deoxy-L-arabinose transferase-like glycosyltransferase
VARSDHSPESRGDVRRWRAALGITAAATIVRLILAAIIPLFPDETYYWDWSRHLAGGYFDHPPMIALLIRAGRLIELNGPTSLSVRLFPVLAGGVATVATAAIARRVAGASAARTAAIVFAVMPLAATGLVLATPDAPLLAAGAVGLYCVVRALQSPFRSRASLGWWSASGVALGFAFCSKYTSILLPVTITAAVLIRPSMRRRLREPGPYIACILATLAFLPVLHWNATHDWISFRFQLTHGLGAPPTGSAIKRELDLVGGQLGLVSPILFALMAYAVWHTIRRPLDDVRFTLAVVAVGSWVFFVYSALRRSVEANWPAPSYIPGVVLLAATFLRVSRERWLRGGIGLAALLVAVLYVQALVPVLPLAARRDPLARNAGWEQLAAQVSLAQQKLDETPADTSVTAPELRGVRGRRSWVGADRYQDVSELAYQLESDADSDRAFCICLGGRHNQYDLWPTFPMMARRGDALVLALDDTPPDVVHITAERLTPYFASVRRGDLAALTRGTDTVGVRRVWILEGYRGGWPARTGP